MLVDFAFMFLQQMRFLQSPNVCSLLSMGVAVGLCTHLSVHLCGAVNLMLVMNVAIGLLFAALCSWKNKYGIKYMMFNAVLRIVSGPWSVQICAK